MNARILDGEFSPLRSYSLLSLRAVLDGYVCRVYLRCLSNSRNFHSRCGSIVPLLGVDIVLLTKSSRLGGIGIAMRGYHGSIWITCGFSNLVVIAGSNLIRLLLYLSEMLHLD